jgi:hypothetical protein
MRYVKCAFMLFVAGMTLIMASAQSDDVSAVKYLLGHGGELMKSDDQGWTALHHAASTGSSPLHMHMPVLFCIIKYVSVQGTVELQ